MHYIVRTSEVSRLFRDIRESERFLFSQVSWKCHSWQWLKMFTVWIWFCLCEILERAQMTCTGLSAIWKTVLFMSFWFTSVEQVIWYFLYVARRDSPLQGNSLWTSRVPTSIVFCSRSTSMQILMTICVDLYIFRVSLLGMPGMPAHPS